jgi:RNA polymerase-interacting CarD/CdnL/TRCF family regulator
MQSSFKVGDKVLVNMYPWFDIGTIYTIEEITKNRVTFKETFYLSYPTNFIRPTPLLEALL